MTLDDTARAAQVNGVTGPVERGMRQNFVAWLLVLSGCAAAFGQTDGFPEKLAGGCASVEQCRALAAESEARVAACRPNTVGMIRCGDAKADRVRAREILRQAETRELVAKEEIRAREEARKGAEAARAAEQRREEIRESLVAAKAERAADEMRKHAERCERDAATEKVRRENYDRRVAEIAASNARRVEAEQWIKKHCWKGSGPVYETRTYVDGNGFVRVGRIVVGREEATNCPTNTPQAVIDTARLELDSGKYIGDWPAIQPALTAHPFAEKAPDPSCAEPKTDSRP